MSRACPPQHPTFPPSPAACSPAAVMELLATLQSTGEGNGYRSRPGNRAASRGARGKAAPAGHSRYKGCVTARLGVPLPPALWVPKQGGSARPGLARSPAGRDSGLSPSNRASQLGTHGPAQVWELGTRGWRKPAVSTAPLIVPLSNSHRASQGRQLQRAMPCPQNTLCLKCVCGGTVPKCSQEPFCHSKGPGSQD